MNMSPLRAAILGLIITCPVGEKDCNSGSATAWVEISQVHPTTGEIISRQLVCGTTIAVNGRCIIVRHHGKVIAAACPGMAYKTDLPANYEPLPAEAPE